MTPAESLRMMSRMTADFAVEAKAPRGKGPRTRRQMLAWRARDAAIDEFDDQTELEFMRRRRWARNVRAVRRVYEP